MLRRSRDTLLHSSYNGRVRVCHTRQRIGHRWRHRDDKLRTLSRCLEPLRRRPDDRYRRNQYRFGCSFPWLLRCLRPGRRWRSGRRRLHKRSMPVCSHGIYHETCGFLGNRQVGQCKTFAGCSSNAKSMPSLNACSLPTYKKYERCVGRKIRMRSAGGRRRSGRRQRRIIGLFVLNIMQTREVIAVFS